MWRSSVVVVACLAACGSPSGPGAQMGDAPSSSPDDAGVHSDDSGTSPHDASMQPDAGPTGGAITCPGPGNPVQTSGVCGTERWPVKTGTDPQAPQLGLVPVSNTIAALVALPAAGGGTSRESPTETTLWELKNVTLTELKLETDRDYHLVLSDGSKTLIAEVPFSACATNSPWLCFMSRSRSEIDMKFTVSNSPQYPAAVVTVVGFGFFDTLHGQNGVAPNAIELHPILQICFGKDCVPN